jgi:DNA repair protein RadC
MTLSQQDLCADSLVEPDFTEPRPGTRFSQQLWSKLMAPGMDAVPDRELLENLLRLIQPEQDAERVVCMLIARFGSYSKALAASVPELICVEGIGQTGVLALKMVQATAQRLLKSHVMNASVLNNWGRLMDYLQAVLGHETKEHFRVLFLDCKNRLLADEALTAGTVNRTPVYPREVVKRALDLHASAIILVHNHPSGDPSPSPSDIEITRLIRGVCSALDIVLHDHVIVGNGSWISLLEKGLL